MSGGVLQATCKRLVERAQGLTGQFNHDKVIGWVEIIFAALVNDAQIAVPFGLFVRQHAINLVQLKRGWIL